MAIFVALIFQVLFLFFAMAINLALVVHDKINLQNAVDLSAYYAAEKQAQILDVIAHTNYQIRQAWKLLNFRYYYLGSLGRTSPMSPSAMAPGSVSDSQTYWGSSGPPPLCIVYPLFKQVSSDDLCKSTTFSFPNVPIPSFSVPFIPASITYMSLAQEINKNITQTCQLDSAYNWWFAAQIFLSYAHEQEARQKLIRALADELSLPIQQHGSTMIDVTDRSGGSVWLGAYKTFTKNLTESNRIGLDKKSFQIYNGLQGIPSTTWLPSIPIYFTLEYQDFTGSKKQCQSTPQYIFNLPSQGTPDLDNVFGAANVHETLQYIQSLKSLPADSPHVLTLGVEKNPWFWSYVAVEAQSKPRELFFPFTKPVTFKAVAYAMPFGGEVGPWFGSSWPSGAAQSSGQFQPGPERLGSGGAMSASQAKKLVPNYSRYPGDQEGAESALWGQALAGLHNISGSGGVYPRASYNDYLGVIDLGSGSSDDGLAWSLAGANGPSSPGGPSTLRQYEIAAVAPDLFDITYYSIQPNFPQRYLQALADNASNLGVSPSDVFADMGSRVGSTTAPALSQFSVVDQINVSNGTEGVLGPGSSPSNSPVAAGNSRYISQAYWHVTNPANLLTSWVGNKFYADYDYTTTEGLQGGGGRFGNCETPVFQPDGKPTGTYNSSGIAPALPDACISNGGRSGYSVKIVSRQVLGNGNLSLGNSGSGSIANFPAQCSFCQ